MFDPDGRLNQHGRPVRDVMFTFEEIYFNTPAAVPSFSCKHFRPVKKTSIKLLEEILQGKVVDSPYDEVVKNPHKRLEPVKEC